MERKKREVAKLSTEALTRRRRVHAGTSLQMALANNSPDKGAGQEALGVTRDFLAPIQDSLAPAKI